MENLRHLAALLLFIFTSICVSAQSPIRIANGSFENNSVQDCRNTSAGDNFQPFNNDGQQILPKINNWRASHGSPQLNKSGCPTGPPNQALVKDQDFAAFMAVNPISGGGTNREGIYVPTSTIKDKNYFIRLFVQAVDGDATLNVRFANGLPDIVLPNDVSVPSPSSQQVIVSELITDDGQWHEILISAFKANDSYSQFWIFPEGSSIVVDDVMVVESCCEESVTFQNRINPPNTFVNDFILAGSYVDPSKPVGDVIITSDNQSFVEWEAGNLISLQPGFRVEPNGKFVARIKPCEEKGFRGQCLVTYNISVINFISAYHRLDEVIENSVL